MLFDSHKDVVSGKSLVLCNTLGFPGVNWTQKWTKTFNFGHVPFQLKHLIGKDCLEMPLLYDRLPLVEISTNLNHI